MNKKRDVILIVFSVVLLLFIAGCVRNKVTICHIPPGNPDNEQTITVAKFAVPAHLAHGDYLGECTPCTESAWSCTAWSECINEEQTRTCTLINTACSNPDDVKPAETQPCVPTGCTSDADCLNPALPFCVNGECSEEEVPPG